MSPLKNDRGSVLVFITLMIVLLMIMVGMGLDTGQLTYSRSTGQAAVDAAALAAVSAIPTGAHSMVVNRASAFSLDADVNKNNNFVGSTQNPIGENNLTYVQYNDTTGAITYEASIANANGIRVALEQSNPYNASAAKTPIPTPAFLTPFFNLFGGSAAGTNNVNVSAVAALKAIPGIPIAIMQGQCTEANKTTPFKVRQTNANIDNSCWTTYTDNPPSANRVQELFVNSRTCSNLPASSDLITIGTPLELNNGQQASTYEEAYDLFIAKYPGKCWFVPIVPDGTKCNQTSPLMNWAKICPTDVVKHTQGNDPKYILTTVECNQSLFAARDNLCFSTRLVRDTKSGM